MSEERVTLLNEDDEALELTVIATLKLNNKDYAILHNDHTDEDYIFTVKELGDEQRFEAVEDEDELQDVVDAYYELSRE